MLKYAADHTEERGPIPLRDAGPILAMSGLATMFLAWDRFFYLGVCLAAVGIATMLISEGRRQQKHRGTTQVSNTDPD